MNNYIVDPMWFYWLSVVDTFKIIMLVVLVLSFITAVITVFLWLCDWAPDDDDIKKYKNILKVSISSIIVTTLLVIFVPSKQTLIEMMIAKQVTVEFTENALEAVKNATDYIINAIKEVK